MSDKTYLVFVFERTLLDLIVVKAHVFYDDDALEKYYIPYTYSPPGNIFPFFRNMNTRYNGKPASIFAVELPASVKTSTSELQYFAIGGSNNEVMPITRDQAKEHTKSSQSVPKNVTDNKTNTELFFVNMWYSIIGIPVSPKDITKTYLSDLI